MINSKGESFHFIFLIYIKHTAFENGTIRISAIIYLDSVRYNVYSE